MNQTWLKPATSQAAERLFNTFLLKPCHRSTSPGKARRMTFGGVRLLRWPGMAPESRKIFGWLGRWLKHWVNHLTMKSPWFSDQSGELLQLLQLANNYLYLANNYLYFNYFRLVNYYNSAFGIVKDRPPEWSLSCGELIRAPVAIFLPLKSMTPVDPVKWMVSEHLRTMFIQLLRVGTCSYHLVPRFVSPSPPQSYFS